MEFKRRPKLVAALLIGGTVFLVGVGALAASLPAPDRMRNMLGPDGSRVAASRPTASSTTASPASIPSATGLPSVSQTSSTPVTYIVKGGDTLSGIAAWFKLHGYGNLYAANAKVIGADPNLIRPGERLTIANGVMSMRGPA